MCGIVMVPFPFGIGRLLLLRLAGVQPHLRPAHPPAAAAPRRRRRVLDISIANAMVRAGRVGVGINIMYYADASVPDEGRAMWRGLGDGGLFTLSDNSNDFIIFQECDCDGCFGECTNTPESFQCRCPEGTQGDYTQSHGCIRTPPPPSTAIKKSKITIQREIDEFINEVAILSQINHRNVVKLFGSISMYELRSLSWSDRLRIATETAKAIAYLHSSVSIPIIHRDIKSANILLDDTLTSKVSDFGASRYIPVDQIEVTTKVQGTLGYMDPTYYYTQRLTEKSDVYSFGVILVELLTRKKPFSHLTHEGEGLVAYFVTSFTQGNLVNTLDLQVMKEANVKVVEEVATLVVACLQLRGEDRPTMRQVEMTLDGIQTYKDQASGNLSVEKFGGINSTVARNFLPTQEERCLQDGTRQYSLEEEILLSSSSMAGGLFMVSMPRLVFFAAALAVAEAVILVRHPGCPTTCGDVAVPFPFGIGAGCYYSESPGFSLTCDRTTHPPRLLLGNAGAFQVLNIFIANATVRAARVGGVNITYGGNMSSSPSSTDEGRAEEQGWLAQATISVRLDETVVAVSLGWAIASAHLGQDGAAAPENATCAGNACESKHSSCRHVVAAATDGYVCDCDDGFQGNPYIAAGCQRNPTNGSCQGCYSNTRAPIFFLSLGLSIGVGALLIILGILIFRNHKHRRTKKLRQKYFRQNRGQLLQQLVAQRTDIAERMIIPLEKLEGATNNFDKSFEIGGGAHGTVYKGILSDLHVIAIKKSRIVVQREIDEFINEIAILSQINHRNVVKLIGCCLETEVPLLVYEFVSNGTLYSHLHVNGSRSLPWSDRLRIATEIAKAIAYLHSSISIPIIHRDIKSTNILLDDSLTSKVSDFGASRYVPNDQTGITTKVQGTFGYMDPTYYYTQKLTEKSDVYSFGVILVELLTRKKPFLPHIIEGEGKMLLLIAILALSVHLVAAAAAMQPHETCLRRCGDFEIPYPFGIGSGCHLETGDWTFVLSCNRSEDGRLRVYNYQIEVVDISVRLGQLRIYSAINPWCYNGSTGAMNDQSNWGYDMSITNFRINDALNRFTVIGCNSLAYILSPDGTPSADGYMTACMATCPGVGRLENGSCAGVGCCQTAIPGGLNGYQVVFEEKFNTSGTAMFSRCSYTVLVDSRAFNFSTTYVTTDELMVAHGGQLPLVLDWAIGNKTCKEARQNASAITASVSTPSTVMPVASSAIAPPVTRATPTSSTDAKEDSWRDQRHGRFCSPPVFLHALARLPDHVRRRGRAVPLRHRCRAAATTRTRRGSTSPAIGTPTPPRLFLGDAGVFQLLDISIANATVRAACVGAINITYGGGGGNNTAGREEGVDRGGVQGDPRVLPLPLFFETSTTYTAVPVLLGWTIQSTRRGPNGEQLQVPCRHRGAEPARAATVLAATSPDPNALATSFLSIWRFTNTLTKSDSFGIILVEFLTRKKPFSHVTPYSESLIARFVTTFTKSNMPGIIDLQVMKEVDMKIVALAVTLGKAKRRRPAYHEAS
uniref:non-specific serine/threonine protein kinase n=1 Tax=Leersia perrieri TaxID=77586 RepID=A0A0D9XGT3_9ORYZ